MSPNFALLSTLIFCLAIYWADFKRDPDTSLAIWIPTLWMMRCASRSLSYWFASGDLSPVSGQEGSIHDEIFLGTLIILGAIILAKRRIDWAEVIATNKWLFLFYGYMGLSIIWSEYPEVSFKRWVRTIGDLIIVLVILTEADALRAIGKVIRRCSLLLIPVSVIMVKYFPDYGRFPDKNWGPDMWIGIATHKNTLGQLLLIATIYLLWHIAKSGLRKTSLIQIAYLLMILYLLNGGGHSRSSTCIFLVLISIGIYFLFQHYKSAPNRLGSAVIGLFMAICFLLLADMLLLEKSTYSFIVEAQGKDTTLTGRTDLWRDLIPLGMNKPLLGSGYSDFWSPPMMSSLKKIHTWGPGQAHNGYIDLFLNLGIVGLILFCCVFISAVVGGVRQCRSYFDYGQFRLILLIATLIHNCTESGFTRPTHLIWFAFLEVAINISYGTQRCN